jgi:hypothetical protein
MDVVIAHLFPASCFVPGYGDFRSLHDLNSSYITEKVAIPHKFEFIFHKNKYKYNKYLTCINNNIAVYVCIEIYKQEFESFSS